VEKRLQALGQFIRRPPEANTSFALLLWFIIWFHDPIASPSSWEAWRLCKSSEMPPNYITNEECFSLVYILGIFREARVENK